MYIYIYIQHNISQRQNILLYCPSQKYIILKRNKQTATNNSKYNTNYTYNAEFLHPKS